MRIQNAVAKSGSDVIYGNAEFYHNGVSFDKTQPMSLIGETSSALMDGYKHRSVPSALIEKRILMAPLFSSVSILS